MSSQLYAVALSLQFSTQDGVSEINRIYFCHASSAEEAFGKVAAAKGEGRIGAWNARTVPQEVPDGRIV